MSDVENELHNGSSDDSPAGERGGFVALAVLAAALGAGAALWLAPDQGSKTREIRRRQSQSRREKRIIALAGLMIGAGVAALLSPESGAEVRTRLGGTLSRIKVGAIGRIERLRSESDESASAV